MGNALYVVAEDVAGASDLTSLLSKGTEVFTWIFGNIGMVGTTIMSNDLMLLGVVVGISGTVINFFKSLLHN